MEEENKEQKSLKEKIENADSFDEMKKAVKDSAKEKIKSIKPVKKVKIIVGLVIGVFLFGCVIFTMKSLFPKNKSTLSISSSVEKIVHINELTAFSFPYEGICKVKDEKGNIKHYIKYSAKISLGIDCDKITNHIDEENKTITLYLPKIEPQGGKSGYNISPKYETIEKGFGTKKLQEGTVFEEIEKELDEIFMENYSDNELIDSAKESIESVFTTLIGSINSEYEVIYEWEK